MDMWVHKERRWCLSSTVRLTLQYDDLQNLKKKLIFSVAVFSLHVCAPWHAVPMEAKRGQQNSWTILYICLWRPEDVFCSCFSRLNFWDRVSQLIWSSLIRLGWLACKPHGPSISAFRMLDIELHLPFPSLRCRRSECRSPGLHGKSLPTEPSASPFKKMLLASSSG